MKSVVKYPGSKWAIAEWIINHFPEHHSYLEPFFGSGAVLFSKGRSPIETINDLDGDVVNLFEQIRTNPEELARAIYLTPYSREVYTKAFSRRGKEVEPLERALNFYIRLMMSHGFRTAGGRVGWKHDVQGREAAYAARDWCDLPDILMEASKRLRGVQIENKPALDLIRQYNYENVLIYADPPYLMETRFDCRQYNHEMTEQDHIELLEALKAHKGPVLLSGYPSLLYERTLEGWTMDTIRSRTQNGKVRVECLWMNFNTEPSIYDLVSCKR